MADSQFMPIQTQTKNIPQERAGIDIHSLLVVICLAAIVVLLWLPFGFKTTGLMEEWLLTHDWEIGGKSERGQDVGLFVTTGTLVLRPLAAAAFILPHEATPDSFLGYNLYTMLTFFMRGLLLYAILCKLLPGNKLFAIAVGILFVIFPADDALFIFRGMNMHTAVWFYLLAVYLLLSFYEKPHILKVIVMWICLLIALFALELFYPIVAFTPLILLWKERRLSKRVVRISLVWWVVPVLAFLYIAFMFTRGETYQSWLLSRSGLNQSSVVGEIANSILLAYRRHFFDGWGIAIQQLNFTSWLFPFTLVATGIAALILGKSITKQDDTPPSPLRPYIEMFFIGIIVIFLGYIVYMITPYRQDTWRVYYVSGIGGAICIGCLVHFVARRFQHSGVIFAGIMSLLIGLSIGRALHQHEHYVGLSIQQQQLLRGIVSTLPKWDASATLVVVDETGRYRNNWSLGTSYLVEYALRYIYDDYTLQVVLCSFNLEQNSFGILPELHEQCEFTADEIRLYEAGELSESIGYANAIVVRFADQQATLLDSIPTQYLSEQGGENYNPEPFVDLTAAPPYHYHTVFSISD